MAKLPSALKRKNDAADQAQRLRRENLTRLNAGQESRGQPEPAVQQQEAASIPAAAPEVEEVRQLKSRLSTSEGMLRAEGERHRQERDAWDTKFRQMQKELQNLQQHKPAARIPLQELQRFVTPQQLKEFGEEHCRLLVATVQAAAGEVTRGAVQAEVAELRAELQQQRAAMRRSQDAAFWASLNAALPRWREINANAEFLRWLEERDALAGRTRQEILNEARNAQDVDRVVAIFNAWMASQARTGSGRDPSRRVIPNGKPPASLPAEAPAESAVSRGWIAEQNRLFSQGYYRRRPEQWAAVQETIDRAAREGRIR